MCVWGVSAGLCILSMHICADVGEGLSPQGCWVQGQPATCSQASETSLNLASLRLKHTSVLSVFFGELSVGELGPPLWLSSPLP